MFSVVRSLSVGRILKTQHTLRRMAAVLDTCPHGEAAQGGPVAQILQMRMGFSLQKAEILSLKNGRI